MATWRGSIGQASDAPTAADILATSFTADPAVALAAYNAIQIGLYGLLGASLAEAVADRTGTAPPGGARPWSPGPWSPLPAVPVVAGVAGLARAARGHGDGPDAYRHVGGRDDEEAARALP
jgi:hypothetical protein